MIFQFQIFDKIRVTANTVIRHGILLLDHTKVVKYILLQLINETIKLSLLALQYLLILLIKLLILKIEPYELSPLLVFHLPEYLDPLHEIPLLNQILSHLPEPVIE